MASPSRKEGLRCDCGRLLLEKDPELGLGVRCGRRECDKFHPLGEINQRAAGFKNQKENKEEVMEEQKRGGEKELGGLSVTDKELLRILLQKVTLKDVPEITDFMIQTVSVVHGNTLRGEPEFPHGSLLCCYNRPAVMVKRASEVVVCDYSWTLRGRRYPAAGIYICPKCSKVTISVH